MRWFRTAPLVAAGILAATGCGGDKKCDPAAQTGCSSGQVCENVQGGTPACFAPVVVQGRVFDLASNAAVQGAKIVALDVNRAPVSAVATSDASGNYELGIPSTRTSDGKPVSQQITLRADASGYQGFPEGLRVALPIDTASAVSKDGKMVVASTVTDVGLIKLPAGAGSGMIHGKVQVPADHGGVLVVAETSASGTPVGASAVADRDGTYRIFNLDAASYTVRAYAKGLNYDPVSLDLAAAQDATVNLNQNKIAAATLAGSVDIVATTNVQNPATSVILVVASTFDASIGRGDAPPGLRTPAAGLPLNVTGAFTIDGVPDGKYIVLAAFENDGLVRDISNIGGTAPVPVDISNGGNGAVVTLPSSFKVTSAIDLLAPAWSDTSPITQMSNPPTFSWSTYPSAQNYDVVVVDSFGNIAWKTNVLQASPSVSVQYGTGGTPSPAPALVSGMVYQVHVIAYGQSSGLISQTEDLKGVFTVP